MDSALKDLRYATRQLLRAPGFAITAILTLALGIGANTAIFSLLDQALLRSLPVDSPQSLVVLRDDPSAWSGSISMSGGDQPDYFSYPQYVGLRDQGHDFASLAATLCGFVGFTRNNASQFVSDEVVSGNYFQTLGVAAALGRLLQPSDDAQPGANPVAVVSYSFWQDKLGADPSIVGSTVKISGHPFQIIGVAAPRFESAVWGRKTNVFVPMSMLSQAFPQADNTRYNDHGYKWLSIIGRLAPGVTREQAAAANQPLWHALRANDLQLLGAKSASFRTRFMASKLILNPGSKGFNFNRNTLEKPFLAVMAMALLVLLIASVNVASLLMVRSAGRVREFSLRAALGASSSRVLAQLLLEGILIGVSGGVVGVLMAPFALRLLISRLADQDGDSPFSSAIDHRVLFFNFGISILVSLFFSLVPALQLRKLDLTSTLRESSGTGAGGMIQLRRIVVCLQIGLSVVLLVGAGLFIRTMQQLRAVDVGFKTTHLVVFNIDPQLAGYSAEATPAIHQRVLDGLAAMPGIQSIAASDNQELAQSGNYAGINVTNYQRPQDDEYQVQDTTVTPDYLATMQIPLLAGRNLSDYDTADHPHTTLVNQVFVKHFCNGSNASCIGRHITYGKPKLDHEIVGVFRDYLTRGPRSEAPAIMIHPLKQNPDASQIFLYLRTAADPVKVTRDVQTAMHRIDPTLSIGTIQTMDQQIDSDLQNDRMITLLAVAFGILATILAGVGLYGVLAYSTAQRTREIGIRMALGSSRAAVAQLVLADLLKLAATGIVVAIPVAYFLGRLVQSQLYGVSAADPVILLSVVVLISLVALLSAVIPARRAATTQPQLALRSE